MFKQGLSFALSLIVDFVDANFLVPRRDGEMVADGRKGKI